MKQTLMTVLIVVGIGAAVVGFSYLEEGRYRAFERTVMADQTQLPFSRVIHTAHSADLVSPWSWFDARTHLISIAVPDAQTLGRFMVISFHIDDAEPAAYLVDTECEAGNLYWYQEREAEAGESTALTIWGEPVLGNSGDPFVQIANYEPPADWLRPLCEHDWEPERRALRSVQR